MRMRLGAIAATLALAACGGTATPTTTPQQSDAVGQSSPGATTTATVGPTLTPAPDPWTVSEAAGPAGVAPPVAIAISPRGAVIVGDRGFGDPITPADPWATVYRSDDLRDWTTVSDPGLRLGDLVPLSGPVAGMVAVAAGPDGFVAVGTDLVGHDERDPVVGLAWRSGDGRRWTPIPLPESGAARPVAVAWTGERYVVVGVRELPDAPRMGVWLSSDGIAWRRVADGPDFAIGGYIDTTEYHAWAGPADLVLDPAGGLVAVGRTCTAGRGWTGEVRCSAVVWRSADGRSWSREVQPARLPGSVTGGAVLGDRVVLVGATADEHGNLGSGRVLLGAGDDWRVVEPVGLPALEAVTVIDGVIYAIGWELPASIESSKGLSLWRSPDGVDWSRVAGFPDLLAISRGPRSARLTVDGERLVALVSIVREGEPGFVGEVIVGRP